MRDGNTPHHNGRVIALKFSNGWAEVLPGIRGSRRCNASQSRAAIFRLSPSVEKLEGRRFGVWPCSSTCSLTSSPEEECRWCGGAFEQPVRGKEDLT